MGRVRERAPGGLRSRPLFWTWPMGRGEHLPPPVQVRGVLGFWQNIPDGVFGLLMQEKQSFPTWEVILLLRFLTPVLSSSPINNQLPECPGAQARHVCNVPYETRGRE